MSYELAKAYVQIIPSMEGFSSNLQSALSGSSSVSTSVGSVVGGNFASGFSSALGTLTSAVSSAVSGLVDIGKAAFDSVSATASAGDNIDKMSQKIGISAEAYQEWAFVMEHTGTSVDNLQAGMKTLSSKIVDARDSIASMEDESQWADSTFAQLGLTMEDVQNMSNEEILAKTIEGLQGMGEGAERTKLATELLGRAGTDLGALLNTSAEEVAAMKQEVHDLGAVMSDDTVKASAEFEDQLTNLKSGFTGLKQGIISEFLPGINSAMGGLTKLFKGDKGGIQDIVDGIKQTIEDIKKKAPEMAAAAIEIIKALGQALIDNLPMLMESAVEIINGLIDMLMENLPEILDMGIELIVTLAEGIGEALPELIPKITDAIILICDKLTEPDSIERLIGAALKIILGLVKGLGQAMPKLVEKAPEILTNIIQGIVQSLPEIFDQGAEILEELWNGMCSYFGALDENAKQILGVIGGVFVDAATYLYDKGKELIKGLWEGISSMGGWLYNNLQNFVHDNFSWIPGITASTGSTVASGSIISSVSSSATPSKTEAENTELLKTIADKDTSINIDGQEVARVVTINISEQMNWTN